MRARVLQLTRVRALKNAGSRTLYFKAPGQTRRQPLMFFQPRAVPEFEGDEAWFLAERPPGCAWRVDLRVNADGSPCAERPPGHA